MSRQAAVDFDALARAMRVKMGTRTQGTCANEAGITASTFSRLVRNRTDARNGIPAVETENVVRVCRWLGMSLETFTGRGQPPRGTLDAIEWHLLRDAKLSRGDALRLATMMRAAYGAVARKSEARP